MNKTLTLIAGISIGLTCLISTIFGFAGASIIGTFWGWFWVSLLVQVIGFACYNSYLIKQDQVRNQMLELETLDKISKFTVKLSCAYCQQFNTIPILLNQKNTFKCESCNQVNGVSMQFMATTLTSPVESVNIPLPNSESIEFKVSV
jgi:hypothetical protein